VRVGGRTGNFLDGLSIPRFAGYWVAGCGGGDVISQLRSGLARGGDQFGSLLYCRVRGFIGGALEELDARDGFRAEAVRKLRQVEAVRSDRLVGVEPKTVAFKLCPTAERPVARRGGVAQRMTEALHCQRTELAAASQHRAGWSRDWPGSSRSRQSARNRKAPRRPNSRSGRYHPAATPPRTGRTRSGRQHSARRRNRVARARHDSGGRASSVHGEKRVAR